MTPCLTLPKNPAAAATVHPSAGAAAPRLLQEAGTSVDELLKLNNLTDPNFLRLGAWPAAQPGSTCRCASRQLGSFASGLAHHLQALTPAAAGGAHDAPLGSAMR